MEIVIGMLIALITACFYLGYAIFMMLVAILQALLGPVWVAIASRW